MYKTMISKLEKTGKLRLLGYNLYETFDKCMHIFTRKEYPLIHDELISKKIGYQRKSYVGTKNCGSACFIMKYLLEREGYYVNVIRNSRRTEYGIEDHVFLYLDDNIFDPTYRQFMIDSRNKNSICGYKQHLFGELSPFIINEKDEIHYQLQNSLDVNKWVYKSPFIKLDELMVNWEFQEDVTEKFNLHKYVNNKDLLKDKPDYYGYLTEYLNLQNLQK
jgi:hypothetical protein